MNKKIVPIHIGVAGHFKLGVGKPGQPYRDLVEFDNLITNSGLDQIGNGGGGSYGIPYLFSTCKVGTGSTTPAFTDTTLAATLASSTNENNTVSFVEAAGAVPAYWKNIKTWRFGVGAATGNISEVGTFDAASGLAFSRALVTDGSGNPIVISVLSDEVLDVTYEFRSYIDKTVYTTNVTIAGVVYSQAMKPYTINSPPQMYLANRPGGDLGISTAFIYETNVLPDVYTGISGSATGASPTLSTYTLGTYYKDFTYTFGTSVGNYATGIGSMYAIFNQAKFMMGFTPKIPKTNVKTFAITYRLSWARYTP